MVLNSMPRENLIDVGAQGAVQHIIIMFVCHLVRPFLNVRRSALPFAIPVLHVESHANLRVTESSKKQTH